MPVSAPAAETRKNVKRRRAGVKNPLKMTFALCGAIEMTGREDTQLDIRTLGGLDVTVAGAPVRVPTRKVQLLLVAVAMAAAMTTSRERLIGLLWSDRSDAQARGSLRHALAALRKALPDPSALVAPSGSVGLDPAKTECDAARFLALASCDPASAADLYRGPFLADCDFPDSAFEDWALAERRSLHASAQALVDASSHHFNRLRDRRGNPVIDTLLRQRHLQQPGLRFVDNRLAQLRVLIFGKSLLLARLS